MGSRSPDSPFEVPPMLASAPAVLAVTEEPSREEPPDDKHVEAEPRQKGSGLTRLITRIHSELRARVVDKNRCNVFTIAASRFNRLASWIHACRLARKAPLGGHGVHDPYGTLRSEEDWSTSMASAELTTAHGPGDFKDVEL
ncbi:uncharacterized protein LOC144178121 [Haemaphysalis longicornis]